MIKSQLGPLQNCEIASKMRFSHLHFYLIYGCFFKKLLTFLLTDLGVGDNDFELVKENSFIKVLPVSICLLTLFVFFLESIKNS